MKRVMCVYLPQWPLQHLWQRRPELRDKPVALARPFAERKTTQAKGAYVSLCCPRAERAGVKPGMPVAEALAVQRCLYVQEEDAAADRQALEHLAEWAQRFSPIVGVDAEGQSLLLDITGCAACFHGEDRLAEQASRELKGQGWTADIAVADTVGAAWALAHAEPIFLASGGREPPESVSLPKTSSLHACSLGGLTPPARHVLQPHVLPPGETETALAPLPLVLLRLPEEATAMLAALGIERIADLAALPRSSVPGRFGLLVLERLDQAMGRLAEPIVSHQPLPEIDADYPFEYPTDRSAVLCQALDQILEHIERTLRSRNRGAKKVECWLYHETLAPDCMEVGLFRPSGSARHLAKLLQEKLERMPLAEPVARLRVRVPVVELLVQRQLELFDVEASRLDELGDLIDRLAAQFGREAVTFARLVEDYQPEYTCRFEPAIADKETRRKTRRQGDRETRRDFSPGLPASLSPCLTEGILEGHRPLLLWSVPQPIEVLAFFAVEEVPAGFVWQGREYAVTEWWGPERIATGWWRRGDRHGKPNGDIERDYYQVETDNGARFWLFRELQDKRWFLHGCFD